MLGFRSAVKWLRSGGRPAETLGRKVPRSRPAVEVLEDRCLLSTTILQTNLVSDLAGVAQVRDANLVNPWGLSIGSNGFGFWVSSNANSVAEAYGLSGSPLTTPGHVAIPFGAPTGQVINGTGSRTDFLVTDGTETRPAQLLFASETGWITGWNVGVGGIVPGVGVATFSPNAEPGFLAPDGAVYKGLALARVGAANFLYAADFHNGKIDVIDGQFHKVAPGTEGFESFTDPTLPNGFAPFNVAAINGKLNVSYARQDANGHDDVAGNGNGFLDLFEPNGHFDGRLVSGGDLNSPWGLALAPAGFGDFGTALLVGNAGDGKIHAFDPTTGVELGTLTGALGQPVAIGGLHALTFGTGGTGGDPNTLFFTAGLAGGAHGLFGTLEAVPDQPPAATGTEIAPTAGTPFTGVVASLVPADAGATAADFSATIEWGDGHVSTGTVAADGHGGFTVTGTNTYTQARAVRTTVTVTDTNPTRGFFGSTLSVQGTATVQPGTDQLLDAFGTAVTGTAGTAFTGPVATFTDADPSAVAGDFSAFIVWGDGQTSSGTVAADGHGGFLVNGTHTYAQAGSDTISVTITDQGGTSDAGGSTATASGTATIAAAAPPTTPGPTNPPPGPAGPAPTPLVASANPARKGKAVTFTATVRGAPGMATPTGTVTFKVGDAVVAQVRLDAGGQASLTVPAPRRALRSRKRNAGGLARLTGRLSAAGRFTIQAVYGGDDHFAGSAQALTEHVR
jgi:uncharacterized protein (TIGR03118 family)